MLGTTLPSSQHNTDIQLFPSVCYGCCQIWSNEYPPPHCTRWNIVGLAGLGSRPSPTLRSRGPNRQNVSLFRPSRSIDSLTKHHHHHHQHPHHLTLPSAAYPPNRHSGLCGRRARKQVPSGKTVCGRQKKKNTMPEAVVQDEYLHTAAAETPADIASTTAAAAAAATTAGATPVVTVVVDHHVSGDKQQPRQDACNDAEEGLSDGDVAALQGQLRQAVAAGDADADADAAYHEPALYYDADTMAPLNAFSAVRLVLLQTRGYDPYVTVVVNTHACLSHTACYMLTFSPTNPLPTGRHSQAPRLQGPCLPALGPPPLAPARRRPGAAVRRPVGRPARRHHHARRQPQKLLRPRRPARRQG